MKLNYNNRIWCICNCFVIKCLIFRGNSHSVTHHTILQINCFRFRNVNLDESYSKLKENSFKNLY